MQPESLVVGLKFNLESRLPRLASGYSSARLAALPNPVGATHRRGLGRAIPNLPRNESKIAGAILACWSLVHGLTMLLADGLVGPRKKYEKLSDSVVQSHRLPAVYPWHAGDTRL
jgi:hypothetical protein